MAKVFTITEGVENLGALKSGGQGSVFKGKRIGEIITAIKILPTPIFSETGDDKNFTSFQNEVQKLKKVNEDPNPNVVTITNSGITESGNFPFIEMEYIEGPDLAELLKPPHAPIFTIKETLKVAEQLSNALAHCHKVEVKHGDIKSNNVKFNIHNGNYILLDFGLSVMSDEQRRTSLRQAGAIEFMAPEQFEGHLYYESEIYSFGVIIFELLCGTVPFPLADNGETARNAVMVSHLENGVPNLLSIRQEQLPEDWPGEKKKEEMQVPEWLLSMIYKCLEKKPADRFSNGMMLQGYIVRNSILAASNLEWGTERLVKVEQENDRLAKENRALLDQIADLEKINLRHAHLSGIQYQRKKRMSAGVRAALIAGCLVAILAVAAIFINAFSKNKEVESNTVSTPIVRTANIPLTPEQNFQLGNARTLLTTGRLSEARVIFRSLAVQDIPEAMYEYGNLTLLNNDDPENCAEGMTYLNRAISKGYIPAKRTAGLLYAFAADSLALKQKGYFGCVFNVDVKRGAKLLMEATMQGDSTASTLLDELNIKYGSR
ncbi:MAG: serine/threonine-protein kinase [Bacteroidota bacterium]